MHDDIWLMLSAITHCSPCQALSRAEVVLEADAMLDLVFLHDQRPNNPLMGLKPVCIAGGLKSKVIAQ